MNKEIIEKINSIIGWIHDPEDGYSTEGDLKHAVQELIELKLDFPSPQEHKTAKEFLQNKYPYLKEKWGMHEVIDDDWVADMMEQFSQHKGYKEACTTCGKSETEEYCFCSNAFHVKYPYEPSKQDNIQKKGPES